MDKQSIKQYQSNKTQNVNMKEFLQFWSKLS